MNYCGNVRSEYEFDHGDADVLGERILLDLKNAFKKDPLIDEFDILPAHGSICNKCPVVLVEHKLALEDWCVKHVYIYAYAKFMEWRQHWYRIDCDTLLSWTGAILLINPEIITAWNARKEIISQNLFLINEELKFCEIVLSRKPKSSHVFAHRKWILKEFVKCNPTSCAIQECIFRELSVCTRVASLYPNNYYAWSHRMWIMEDGLKFCLKAILEELSVMEQWVSVHVSDYSGFHYRQFLLTSYMNHSFGKSRDTAKVENCPIHVTTSPECDCVKCNILDVPQAEIFHFAHYSHLVEHEMSLITELQFTFQGHESLWNHRRFAVNEHSRVLGLLPQFQLLFRLNRCSKKENVVPCKKHRLELDLKPLQWDLLKEEQFMGDFLKLAKNNDWENKLISRHVNWMNQLCFSSDNLKDKLMEVEEKAK